jgi:2-polyprenyl-3-methyl-5-hydroxy-6-metoxy-1,4-benzoquinol methylase
MPMTDDFRPSGRHTIARRFLQISPGDTILEVGCHTGYFCRRYLIGRARKVRGIDIDQEAIEYAKATDGDEYYASCNSNALPFDDNEFDKVLCADTLEHVDDVEGTIEEVARVLRPDGLLVLTTPNRFLDFLDPHYPEHRHYSLQELARIIPGFRIERVHRSGLGGTFIVAFLLKYARGWTLRRWIRRLTGLIEDADCAINLGFGFTIAVAARNMKPQSG